MRGSLCVCFSLLLIGANSFGDDDVQMLAVEFETAVASIPPRESDGPIQLPGLTFGVRAQTLCPSSEIPTSFSVSIADSRKTIAPDDDLAIEDEIYVSAEQLGPVVVSNFCLEGESDSMQQLQLEGALSAHLSLRCKGENSESIDYATTPLNVMLNCEIPETETEL